MFYDRFVLLCERKGVSPSKAAESAGLSKSTVSRWKKDPSIMPSGSVLESLAKYFEIPVSEILEDKKEKPTIQIDGELKEVIETYVERPDMRVLFHSAKELSAEDINAALAVMKFLKQKKD